MPSTVTVEHNDRVMTFTEHNHRYEDDKKKAYVSVTGLVGMGFEKFDSEGIAKAKAAREGLDWHDLVNEWAENGRKAANAGTRLHENCEHQILEQFDKMHEAEDPKEKINFDLAYKAVNKLKTNHHNVKFEPEKLVFSPKLGLAGSIDLLVTKDDGTYAIYDWKNVKAISMYGFKNKCGIIEPTINMQDSNYWHYALQLQTYEIILKAENYISRDAKVTRTLNVFEGGKYNQYELPNVMKEAKALIKWNFMKQI